MTEDELKAAAAEFAHRMIHNRGNPHWHDLRDCYLAGHRARDGEVERLRTIVSAQDCDLKSNANQIIRLASGLKLDGEETCPACGTEWSKGTMRLCNEGILVERDALRTQLAQAREIIEWYAAWDWTDKYVQAVPKRAQEFLDATKDGGGDGSK